MRKLGSCETYKGSDVLDAEKKKAPASKQELDTIVTAGYIPVSAIEDALDKIKKTPLLTEAERALRDGRLILLNPQGSNGEFLINIRIPFFVIGDKMYINVTRYGKWSEDKQTYNISPASELSPILQGAYVTYKFMKNSDRMLSDPKIVELTTRIHVEIMTNLLQKFGIIINNASEDDNTTYLRYLCAKFFLIYVLEKSENDPSVSELAFKVAKTSTLNRVTRDLLEMREDGDGFLTNPDQYNTLSGFLMAIMELTRSNITINFATTFDAFTKLYGEAVWHALTYLPYLIYFLEVASKGALPMLRQLRDKVTRLRSLSAYLQQLEKEIIAKG